MGTFHAGDRVRLGRVRGGIVVKVDGVLRVQFPPSKRLLWLDLMVPDEGPDGPIFPRTWNTCPECDNPTRSGFVCINCEARSQRDLRSFARADQRAEDTDRIRRGVPVFGVHVAGPIEQNGRIVQQRCAQCGAQLSSYLMPAFSAAAPMAGNLGLRREGECVFMGGLGLGKLLPGMRPEPTCTPVRERVSA